MQPQDFAAQHSSRIFTWDYNAFHHCFIKPRYDPDYHADHRLNLKMQEDLKALVWAYGGPRPSLISRVEVTVVPDEFIVKVHWEVYDISTGNSDTHRQSEQSSERVLSEPPIVDSVSDSSRGIDSEVHTQVTDGSSL